MAFTVTKLDGSVFGNKRVAILQVTADAASGVITTGLSVVDSVSLCPVSMATAAIKLKRNLSAASAAALGSIMVSSAASGDLFEIVCYGK